ncbi:hypothetical protein OIU76_010736 [Salix suchowensis]|nr:hypothetical protein OIU76_010736 [Salix suchowensis]
MCVFASRVDCRADDAIQASPASSFGSLEIVPRNAQGEVQSAIDFVANYSQKRTIIWINSGIYYEKVAIPTYKQNITFQGQGYTSTAIVWNDTATSSRGTISQRFCPSFLQELRC